MLRSVNYSNGGCSGFEPDFPFDLLRNAFQTVSRYIQLSGIIPPIAVVVKCAKSADKENFQFQNFEIMKKININKPLNDCNNNRANAN